MHRIARLAYDDVYKFIFYPQKMNKYNFKNRKKVKERTSILRSDTLSLWTIWASVTLLHDPELKANEAPFGRGSHGSLSGSAAPQKNPHLVPMRRTALAKHQLPAKCVFEAYALKTPSKPGSL